MPSKNGNNLNGEHFEHIVAELLHLRGYTVERNRTVGGRQTDLLAFTDIGDCRVRVLVECKYRGKNRPIGARDVTDFCARVTNARSAGQVDKGFMVTNTDFTRQSHDVVRDFEGYVALLTFNDLEKQIINFSMYAKQLIIDFERLPLSQYMVDLSCKALNDKRYPSLSNYVRRWIENKEENQMLILGDYGTGKTSFCLYIAAELARHYLKNSKSRRIPILIFLGEYSRAGTTKAMITNWLANECGVPNAGYKAFRRMLESGRFILILDAFDEMLINKNDMIYDNFRNLSELSCPNGKMIITGRPGYFPDLKEMNRILIASNVYRFITDDKTHNGRLRNFLKECSRLSGDLSDEYEPLPRDADMFSSDDGGFDKLDIKMDMKEAAAGIGWQKYCFSETETRLGSTDRTPLYCVLELCSLRKNQIRMIVKARESLLRAYGKSPKEFLDFLRDKYDLSDLAKRPVLLDMIINTFCEIGSDLRAVNTARLYELYTSIWIERDRAKGEIRRLLTPQDKRYFMEEIAWSMDEKQEVKLHYTEIPYFVRKYFQQTDRSGTSPESLDCFSHDIRTCSFLGRDHAGYYRFYHKSFLEFFVAERIHGELKRELSKSMGLGYLSDEVSDFLAQLIDSDDRKAMLQLYGLIERARIGKRLSGFNETVVKASNAIGVLSKIQDALEEKYFTGLRLHCACLADGTNMAGSRLNKSVISNSTFAYCILTMSDVVGAQWKAVDCSGMIGKKMTFRDTTISKTSFKQAMLEGSVFQNVVFSNCNFSGADLSACVFERCEGSGLIFKECDLCGVEISFSTFDDSVFEGANFKKATLVNSKFTRGDFTDTDIAEITVNDCRFTKCNLSHDLSKVLSST